MSVVIPLFLLTALTLASSSLAKEPDIECESYAPCHEASSCCFMSVLTEIKSTGVAISESDNEIDGIDFSENKNILFLPVRVHENLPNLIAYYAFHCSIREISKKNFEKLIQLEDLNLNSNQIEKIPHDTFEDLVSLQQLHISSNLIKQLNGRIVDRLIALKIFDLRKNQCINQWFLAKSSSLVEFHDYVSNIISGSCSFEETEDLEKLVREVETETLINEYENMDEFDSKMLTGGSELRNFETIVLSLLLFLNYFFS